MSWGFRIASVRISLNGPGIREMLNTADIESDLSARADRVAAQVNATYPAVEHEPGDVAGVDVPVAVSSVRGRGVRARARVTALHPSAIAVEAKHSILGAALDAGRD